MAGMRYPPNSLLNDAFAEVRQLLQSAHFAARRLDEQLQAQPDDRIADEIHVARRLLERLAFQARLAHG